MELDQIELRLYHKDGSEFDLVRSDKAQFDMPAKSLFSEGGVEITMGVPAGGPPRGRVLKIHSSGVRFESETGKTVTDRPATFEFDQGGGSAVGAEYDPNTRELHLRGQVTLDWRGKTRDAIPMHAEAGEAVYRERDSKVTLFPWSKLTRNTLQAWFDLLSPRPWHTLVAFIQKLCAYVADNCSQIELIVTMLALPDISMS